MVADNTGLSRPDNIGQSVERSLTDALNTFKMRQQRLLGARPHTLYLRQFTHDCRFRAPVTVMGYAKTVSLVAQLLHHPQRL